MVANWLPFVRTFPFMKLDVGEAATGALLVSAMVSSIYLGVTKLAYRALRSQPAPAAVRFVARNTLIVFLAHMPLYYALWPVLGSWPPLLRSVVYMVICLPGLAWASEGIRKVVRPRELRERVAVRFLRFTDADPLVSLGAATRPDRA